MVCILVEVTYNYYRFQKNICASHSLEEMQDYCSTQNIVALVYKMGDSVSVGLDKDEQDHHWIEVMMPCLNK